MFQRTVRQPGDKEEIDPDVLGYIFEKYINQKQMGAYYTKEDITEYISKNTVIPFLFDAARAKCKTALEITTSKEASANDSRSTGSTRKFASGSPVWSSAARSRTPATATGLVSIAETWQPIFNRYNRLRPDPQPASRTRSRAVTRPLRSWSNR